MNLLRYAFSSWQLWAFLSALFAALTAIFAKLGVKKIPPDVATWVRTVVILFFLTTLIWSTGQLGFVRTLSRKAVVFLILSGLATGFSWICYFRALELGNASSVAAVDKLSVVLVALLAIVFLAERVSLFTFLGLTLISAGAVLVALTGK